MYQYVGLNGELADRPFGANAKLAVDRVTPRVAAPRPPR